MKTNCKMTEARLVLNLNSTTLKILNRISIVQQVEPLRKLVEARQKLADLRSKMDGNEKLENLLNDVIADAGKQKELSDALGLKRGARRNKLWLNKKNKKFK